MDYSSVLELTLGLDSETTPENIRLWLDIPETDVIKIETLGRKIQITYVQLVWNPVGLLLDTQQVFSRPFITLQENKNFEMVSHRDGEDQKDYAKAWRDRQCDIWTSSYPRREAGRKKGEVVILRGRRFAEGMTVFKILQNLML